MPDFPRAHSERALTTKQPRAMRNDADVRNEAAGKAKVMSGAVNQLQSGMQKWQQYTEKVQQDTALYNYKTGLQEISNEAVLDKDITSEGSYQKRVQDLKKDATAGIASERVKQGMAAEINYMETVGSIGIQTEFRKKTVLHGQKVALDNLSLLAQSPGNEEAIKLAAADATKSGYWNEVQGRAQEVKYLKQMRQNWLIQDINEDPGVAEKGILSNKYGFDLGELENAGKIYERELQVIRNQTEEELIDLQSSGGLTEDIVKDMRDKKKIDANFAKSMIKDLNTVSVPKPEALESITGANILAEKFKALKDNEWAWKSASFEDRTKFRADAFDAHRNGFIDDEELDEYLGETSKKFYSSPEFTNAMQAVFDTSQEYVSNEKKAISKQQMTKALMEKVKAGIAPKDALNEVVIDRIGADYPGVDPENLMFTAKKRGLKVWQVYNLVKPTGEANAD